MAHDYTEWMSAALDGRLTQREWSEWNAHLSTCSRCQARWTALQEVDRTFKRAAHVAPAPGFTARLAARLAQRQAVNAARRRTWTGMGVLFAGALLVIAGAPIVWPWLWPGRLLTSLPASLGRGLESFLQWLVLAQALGKIGQTLAGFIPSWSLSFIAGCAWLSVALLTGWAAVLWQLTRPRTAMMMRHA